MMVNAIIYQSAVLVRIRLFFHIAGNLALNRPATQSSTETYKNAIASKAVDGNRNSVYGNRSCSSTVTEATTAWWKVDLERKYWVTDILLVNRRPSCEYLMQV